MNTCGFIHILHITMGSERYSNGTVIKEGFYVCTDTENGRTIVPLEKWLKK